MKVIRVAALGVALLLAATTVADAQGGGGGRRGGGGGGRGGMAALMANITVTPEVQTKIQEIFTKYQEQSMAIRQAAMTAAGGDAAGATGGGGGGRGGAPLDSASQAKITELNAKRNAEIKALLTAEQQTAFDANVAAQAAGRGRRGGGTGGAGGATPPPPPLPAL